MQLLVSFLADLLTDFRVGFRALAFAIARYPICQVAGTTGRMSNVQLAMHVCPPFLLPFLFLPFSARPLAVNLAQGSRSAPNWPPATGHRLSFRYIVRVCVYSADRRQHAAEGKAQSTTQSIIETTTGSGASQRQRQCQK